jgi:hypothetical protein
VAELLFDFGEVEPVEASVGARERPAALPVAAMLRPAKLIADRRELLCMVRNISEVGVEVRLFHALPTHSALSIEFDNGARHPITPVWKSADRIGCAFLGRVDLADIVAADRRHPPRRQPRLAVEHEALIYASRVKFPVVIRNISQRGAAIDAQIWLAVDEVVRIESPVLPVIHGRVRWRRTPRYGLVFEETFGMAELARACSKL